MRVQELTPSEIIQAPPTIDPQCEDDKCERWAEYLNSDAQVLQPAASVRHVCWYQRRVHCAQLCRYALRTEREREQGARIVVKAPRQHVELRDWCT